MTLHRESGKNARFVRTFAYLKSLTNIQMGGILKVSNIYWREVKNKYE